jgi:predicted nucleotidyltransferase
MIPLIQNNIEAIRELCQKHYVRSLYLFGSAVDEQTFGKESDIDFLYEIDTDGFKNWDSAGYDYIDNLNDFEFDLNKLLTRRIDLVPYAGIHNRYFKQVVDNSRQLVYAIR